MFVCQLFPGRGGVQIGFISRKYISFRTLDKAQKLAIVPWNFYTPHGYGGSGKRPSVAERQAAHAAMPAGGAVPSPGGSRAGWWHPDWQQTTPGEG